MYKQNKNGAFIIIAVIIWASQSLIAQAALHPVGSNVVTSEGTVYTITSENGQTVRRPYTSPGAFLSFSFNSWESVVGASPEDLALPMGSLVAPRDGKVICSDRGTDKGTCYLITAGKKAGFTSAEVFLNLGYNFNNAESGDVSFLPTTENINSQGAAHTTGSLVNKDGTVYLVDANGLVGIPSWQTLTSWGYDSTDIVPANPADIARPEATSTLPPRPADNLQVINNSGIVYNADCTMANPCTNMPYPLSPTPPTPPGSPTNPNCTKVSPCTNMPTPSPTTPTPPGTPTSSPYTSCTMANPCTNMPTPSPTTPTPSGPPISNNPNCTMANPCTNMPSPSPSSPTPALPPDCTMANPCTNMPSQSPGSPGSTPQSGPAAASGLVINSLTPESGSVGSIITIKGSGFVSGSNYVNFQVLTYQNGAMNYGSISSTFVDSSTIKFTVPSSITTVTACSTGSCAYSNQITPGTYYIYVTNSAGTSNLKAFTVAP